MAPSMVMRHFLGGGGNLFLFPTSRNAGGEFKCTPSLIYLKCLDLEVFASRDVLSREFGPCEGHVDFNPFFMWIFARINETFE